MKNKILFFSVFLQLLSIILISTEALPAAIESSKRDSFNVVCSPELYSLSEKWARQYCILNPEVKININTLRKGEPGELNTIKTLGFMSSEFFSGSSDKSVWKVTVGRDITVPVINSANPFLAEIYQKGISSEEMAIIIQDPSNLQWGLLLGNSQKEKANLFMINKEYVKSDVSKFLNSDQVIFRGKTFDNESELIKAVQNDPLSIGFCRLADILDHKNQQIVENIKILPIDRNGNDRLDFNEQIYDNLDAFLRGVWIGKYPKTLYSNIYSVAPEKPTNEKEVAFLKWVLTDGQQFITPFGYSDLTINERQSKVDDLNFSSVDLLASKNESSVLKMILLILAITVLVSYALEAGIRYRKNRNVKVPVTTSIFQPVFNENSVAILNGLFFDKTHTWAFMEKNGLVRMGIDDFLQHVTGKLTRIKMKNAGDKINKGEPFLTLIQKGKQLTVFAPVSGIIVEQNETLRNDASLLNSSPYSEGWVYMIEPSNWMREMQFLFMNEKYKNWIKEEFSRLKDFLSVFLKKRTAEYAPVILQDGGELKDNLLSGLEPEVWEDFQTHFLDTSK